jgi:hypothetical protein
MVLVCLHAQAGDAFAESANTPSSTRQDQALDQVWEDLTTMEHRWYGLTRIRWHNTQIVSAGPGAMLVKQPQNIDCATGCSVSGWHVEVEPGLYGIQGGIGWGKLVGETGRTRRLFHTVHFGWSVRAVVLRTWGDKLHWQSGLPPNTITVNW